MMTFLNPLRLLRYRAATAHRSAPAQALAALDQMYAYFDRT